MDETNLTDKRHGQSRTRLYHIWGGMRQRCGHIKCAPERMRNYADRGISVCEEWRDSFTAFAAWAHANGYRDDLTIDREDNDKGYEPGNCRWATYGQNVRNRRVTRVTEVQVAEIKVRLSQGEKYQSVADSFSVSWDVVAGIANDRSWADVPWPEGYVRRTRRPELLIHSNPELARGRKCAKLSFDDVVAVKRRIADGEMFAPIANDYGVSLSTISDINSGRAWPDVEWPEGFTPVDRRKTGVPRPWRRKAV